MKASFGRSLILPLPKARCNAGPAVVEPLLANPDVAVNLERVVRRGMPLDWQVQGAVVPADTKLTTPADCVLTSIWDCRWWSIADRHHLPKLIKFGAARTATYR